MKLDAVNQREGWTELINRLQTAKKNTSSKTTETNKSSVVETKKQTKFENAAIEEIKARRNYDAANHAGSVLNQKTSKATMKSNPGLDVYA